MSAAPPFVVDARTLEIQRRATDPDASAWVSANAGTGKTFVLVQRVQRLLLAGADPATILCLTFTKAAAAEMAKRIFDELAAWTAHDDARLGEILTGLDGALPDRERLNTARRLFARALETPGGLKIQTIHAFCERLLHQFPFEAKVAGHFQVIEESVAAEMVAAARRKVVTGAALDPEGPIGQALAHIVGIVSDRFHDEAIAAAVAARGRFLAWRQQTASLADAFHQLRRRLGLGDHDEAEALMRDIVGKCSFSRDEIARLVWALQSSDKSKNDRDAAERLAPFLTAATDDERALAWLAFARTAAGQMRVASTAVTRSVKDGWPGLDARIAAEFERLTKLLDRIGAARLYEASVALFTIAEAVIADYERAKAARGLLDFDDLVIRTVGLLEQAEAADWVRYKLDRGLDHILVDEAQDTSPSQWRVVQALAEEFFAGKGAREATRTVFAVGDEKQSIYSFQGALPAWFALMQRHFGLNAANAGRLFDELELHLSFRSTDDILTAVDAIFAPPHAHAGLASEARPTVHRAARQKVPGRVVLWAMREAPEKVEPEDWATPLDRPQGADPALVLAEDIAGTIEGWLRRGERLESTGAAIRPGDILILSRRRGLLSEAINRALKKRGVPVAGADRLALGNHIAVMDLLALADVMLLPEDDLALATVLKGPLIGLDEETLFRIAYRRKGSLWAALAAAAATDMFCGTALTRLEEWRGRADFAGPHAFFARLLGPDRGRRDFARRLGAEVDDVLDEFLARTLAYEKIAAPSLQGFVAWMRDAAGEVKRDTDLRRNEVRVMTVHGAKGLEAPIVFLADDGSAPSVPAHDPRIMALDDDPDAAEPAPLVWLPSTKEAPEQVRDRLKRHRVRAAEEYRRLLYVGLTRAGDRLYICGTRRGRTDATAGWHALAETTLAGDCRRIPAAEGAPEGLEWRCDWDIAPAPPRDVTAEAGEAALPRWIEQAVPAEAVQRRLAPSSGSEGDAGGTFVRPGPAGERARQRGALVHSLLQALPDIEGGHRGERARDFLAAAAPDWPAEERDALLNDTLAILDDAAFAPLFAAGSRAEVSLAGHLPAAGGLVAIAGRVDRLAVTDKRVLIVDFKTNRQPPTALAEVPPAYLRQLAFYRVLLQQLYPGHQVEAALLWTAAPRLMEIPGGELDAALAAATRRLD